MIDVLILGADWCSPCRQMTPVVEELKLLYKDSETVTVRKVNVDDEPTLSIQYGIKGIPTTIFFRDGEELKRMAGFVNLPILQKYINEFINEKESGSDNEEGQGYTVRNDESLQD